jgi:hypothetical protein
MRQIHGDLGFTDERQFSLIDYRHGHSYAVIRGIPEPQDDAVGGEALRVVDLFFAGVRRISCWKDNPGVSLRLADATEVAVLEDRIGPIGTGVNVYLLTTNSLEDYVVAGRVYWAEFNIGGGALSPLAAEDHDYRQQHPPIDGTVFYH